jgi:ech hydrogenase subunit F
MYIKGGGTMKRMFSRILKNFMSKPVTRLYPQKEREAFERTRGRIFFDEKDCIYCSICQRKCPADAILVDKPNKTWELNPLRCIICNECVLSCPKKCIKMTNERRHCSETKKIISIKRQEEHTESKDV